jgi:hypothetical protein
MNAKILMVVPLAALLLAACAGPQALQVQDAWARPLPAGSNGGVFFVIENSTGQADRLLSASALVADVTELHMSMMHDGVMQMQMQESVEIPARAEVAFKPGGLHVMLIGLKQGLQPGDTFPLTLIFEKAGKIQVEVTVWQE